jgi:sugar O-acyltransferase (sialic acid O-acetyltransferase NeuD family)
LILIGGGGHALVVADAAVAAGMVLAGFLDDDPNAVIGSGHPGVACGGGLDLAPNLLAEKRGPGWILALGDLAFRRGMLHKILGQVLPRPATIVVHPRAVVSPLAMIGGGVFVGANAVVHALARVESHAIINTGAIIEHECEIGGNAHIAPGAVLAGRCRVGPDTLVGMGARVLPGVSVGRKCTIGAGAVVVDDVEDETSVVGIPARRMSGTSKPSIP